MDWNKQTVKSLLAVVCGGIAFYCLLQHLGLVVRGLNWLLGILSPFLLGAAVAVMILCGIAAIIVALVQLIFTYVVYYDVFASCNPRNAVLYLIFSIVFSFLIPFLMLACRKKDLGMPERVVDAAVVPDTQEETPVEQIPDAPAPVEETPVEEPAPAEDPE